MSLPVITDRQRAVMLQMLFGNRAGVKNLQSTALVVYSRGFTQRVAKPEPKDYGRIMRAVFKEVDVLARIACLSTIAGLSARFAYENPTPALYFIIAYIFLKALQN